VACLELPAAENEDHMSQEKRSDSGLSAVHAADFMPPYPKPAELGLVAYELHRDHGFELVPAWPGRDWMSSTSDRFANRCLPLLMANQAGWLVLNNARVRARWNGAADSDSIEFEYDDAESSLHPCSHFGHGIITWNMPFLIRTSPGFNLLVRGPANWPKHGIASLEGMVETDWTPSTFTMNWQFTGRDVWVTFGKGEPLCMLVPQRRGELEEFVPRIVPINAAPELHAAYNAWGDSRRKFNEDLKDPESAAVQVGWQKDYFQGKFPDGSAAPQHQTRIHLRAFKRFQEPENPGCVAELARTVGGRREWC
jgi:hypothetical protein